MGFDPQLTVERAWQLSSDVQQALSLDELFSKSHFITVHVPLVDATRGIVNSSRLNLMPKQGVVLNFARDGIVDDEAVLNALQMGRLHAYVTDFPTQRLLRAERVIALPHLGASTLEAEENCAVMVADNLREFLEHGNIRNAVNFPDVKLPRAESSYRIAVANANVPNMLGQVTTALAAANLNILDMINQSRGDVAYTMVDVAAPVPGETLHNIRSIHGVLNVRAL
jgi:D-3-phosphoglycerate dehydrogenase